MTQRKVKNIMIYTKNGEYYLKRAEKLFKINAELDKNGNVNLVPAGKSIQVLNDKDLEGYSIINLDDIKKNLTEKVEKVVEEPKVETERFPGLFESKKSNKKYK